MNSQDLFVPKSGPANGPADISAVPAPSRPAKSGGADGAFDSAMRQAIGREPAEPMERRADQPRMTGAGAPEKAGKREGGMGSRSSCSGAGRVACAQENIEAEGGDGIEDNKLAAAAAAEAETKTGIDETTTESSETGEDTEEVADGVNASNIILFPDPNVIIPFPVALAAGDTFRMAAEAQPSGGSMDGGTADGTGEKIVPMPTPAPARSQTAGTNETEKAHPKTRRDDDEEGIDVTKLGFRPTRTAESAGNVEPVSFGPKAATSSTSTAEATAQANDVAAENPIVSVVFQRDAQGQPITQPVAPSPTPPETGRNQAPPETDSTPTQLPGAAAGSEISAGHLGSTVGDSRITSVRQNTGKGPSSTGFAEVQPITTGKAEPAGIPAARQEGHMNSYMDIRHDGALAERGESAFGSGHDSSAPAPDTTSSTEFSPRNLGAMEWQLGRPVSRIDRSIPDTASPAPTVDASATVDRITNLVVREAALVRQYKSDAMAVVLRPDAETELYVHFTQRNGQIEATVRCERGDAQQLSAIWPQLQESLGQQRVRLAPLQESPSQPQQQSNFGSSAGSQTGSGNNPSPRQSPDRQSMDEWSVPASSNSEARHVRGRGESGHRRLTTSRPGWETWA